MKNYDILIVGDGPIGASIATALAPENRRVGLITLPNRPDARLHATLTCLLEKKPARPTLNSPNIPGVDLFQGPCFFVEDHIMNVGGELIRSQKFIIASGALPFVPSLEELQNASWQDPFDFLQKPLPPSVVILGSGPLAVLLAERAIDGGTSVILLANKPNLLPLEEPEISHTVRLALEAKGVNVHLNSHHRPFLAGHAVVLAAGTTPNTQTLAPEKVHLHANATHALVTDEEMRTSSPYIWAAGPVTKKRMSLNLMEHQARLVANNVLNRFMNNQKMHWEPLPESIPLQSWPVAKIGLTEKQAVEQEEKKTLSTVTPRSPHAGLLKIVAQKKTGKILGVHVAGAHAEEIILFFNLAMRAEIPIWDLAEQQHFLPFSAGESLFKAISDWITAAGQ